MSMEKNFRATSNARNEAMFQVGAKTALGLLLQLRGACTAHNCLHHLAEGWQITPIAAADLLPCRRPQSLLFICAQVGSLLMLFMQLPPDNYNRRLTSVHACIAAVEKELVQWQRDIECECGVRQ